METIIRCDEIIKDWWETMPPHLRITDDLFDSNVKLNAENDWIKAVAFCFAHVNIMRVHVCLVKPVILKDREQDDGNEDNQDNQDSQNLDDNVNPELLASIREQAKKTVLRSCDILLDVMVQMLASSTDMPSGEFIIIYVSFSKPVHPIIINI